MSCQNRLLDVYMCSADFISALKMSEVTQSRRAAQPPSDRALAKRVRSLVIISQRFPLSEEMERELDEFRPSLQCSKRTWERKFRQFKLLRRELHASLISD